MTQVYSSATNTVVANGGPYVVQARFFGMFQTAFPDRAYGDDRYLLRDGNRPQISVICIAQGAPGIQTARFKEV